MWRPPVTAPNGVVRSLFVLVMALALVGIPVLAHSSTQTAEAELNEAVEARISLHLKRIRVQLAMDALASR